MPATLDAETAGPVDVAVIAFDGNRFNGDVAPALHDLQANGTVRVLDLAFVTKDAAGEVAFVEIADSEVAGRFEQLTGEEFDLLSDHDLDAVAASLPPESSALVIAWENTWAARLTTALRASGGQVVLMERIPHEDVVRAVSALDEEVGA
ncbi:DUF6325 family protein [Streptomyces filamentosus]|uniref:DUF6325 family protein n=1 Tax=Streptomyces filamentosus TaxID=67294 RepID=UPI003408C264